MFPSFHLLSIFPLFNLEKSYFSPLEVPGGRIFQEDRDLYLNYFDRRNIQNKETTYLNKTQFKNFLYENERFENAFILYIDIRALKTNSENFCNVMNEIVSYLPLV